MLVDRGFALLVVRANSEGLTLGRFRFTPA